MKTVKVILMSKVEGGSRLNNIFLFPELDSIKNITMLKKIPDHFKVIVIELVSIDRVWWIIHII